MLIDLHTDVETASELDLTEVGLDVYSAHPSTRILMVAWELGNEPIKQWSIAEGRPPRELIEHLRNPKIRKWAHHAQFEHVLYSRVWDLDLPIEEWQCTMVWAYMLGLPGKLEDLGKVLLLPEHLQKLAKEGKRLIRKFSMPQKITRNQKHRWRDWKTDPEDWQKFLEYNVQDVVAESFIAKKRLARYEMPQRQWDEWHLDQEINIRGIPMDRLLVANAAAKVRENTELLLQRMHEITKLDNPNSDKQFGPWVRARGYPYHNLKKATVQKVLDDPEMSHLHEVLTIRSQLKKTSVKKYIALDQYIGEGDRLRFTLQFAGASRTQRWAGRLPRCTGRARCTF
jgi:DNA polymerase